MRFSERTHPVLFRIATGKEIEIGEKKTDDVNQWRDFLNKYMIREASENGVECYWCCDTFMEDAGHNWPKICEEVIHSGNYCVVWRKDVYFLKVLHDSPANKVSGYCLVFRDYSLMAAWEAENGTIFIKHRNFESNSEHAFLQVPLIAMMFKKYSTVEARILPKNGKIKDFHCKYKNDCPIDIQVLDMNWYIQSIQSHPFVVRGHWRNQVCGEGRKDRRLTWINSYMKQGYTKGAYMNNE